MAIGKLVCRRAVWAASLLAVAAVAGCNSPYPESEEDENIHYTTFTAEPKHLDPARTYSSTAAIILGQTLEPPFQYHLLKRPYELSPLTAVEVPKVQTRKVTFRGKTYDAPYYTIRIKKGIDYQNHACFVADNRRLTEQQGQRIWKLSDIEAKDTRELVAADFVHAARRLADPRMACQVYATLAKNMLGMDEYQKHLKEVLKKERARRKAAGGALYNAERDEKYNPIRLDYAAGADEFPFVRELDRYRFEVVLKKPYHQMLYWMAMSFFAPVPWEAIEFHDQPILRSRNILFDKSPIGTGPYRLEQFDPTNQISFVRNGNYKQRERYPSLDEPDDPNDVKGWEHYREMKKADMLKDANEPLPMIDRIVFRMERESIPRWNKFLQGYYDSSVITSDMFDRAVTITTEGNPNPADEMSGRGIRLLTSFPIRVMYYCFNMNDPVVGGLSENKCKLRQAISIAFDIEQQITVFDNGRGIPAQSLIPPGIFGHEDGPGGINPYVYDWDAARKRPVRKLLAKARELLAEAGYRNGFGPDRRPLTIRYASTAATGADRTKLKFIQKQFAKLNIRLVIETADNNRFHEKVNKGNYQMLGWGWNADYPDAENFLFLLYGPNSKVVPGKKEPGGENIPNYRNERYDELFEKMESMEDGSERLKIIRKMLEIIRHDAPCIFAYHPLSYGLYHRWVDNAYPHALASNILKYSRLDVADRKVYRAKHNTPRIWPVIVLAGILLLSAVPAVRTAVRHFREA